MTIASAPEVVRPSPVVAWSRRVRKVGGYIHWPLLLWLDHLVHIPRLRPVGWALTVGPILLVLLLSGTALEVTTGLAAGLILLGTATAGFHDLANLRSAPTGSVRPVQHARP